MKNVLTVIAAFISIIAISAVLIGYPIMLLWNWTLPDLFNIPRITFFQALGLGILASILFKSSNTNK